MGHLGFPTKPGPHQGQIGAGSGFCKLPGWQLALPAVPTAGVASVKLAPRDLMTDHFLAGSLGPGHLHTRSWSFRSKNRLAFSQKQNTPVLPETTLLKGGAQTTLATQIPPLRLPGVWLVSNDKPALFTHGYCPAEPTLASEDPHLRIPMALWTQQILHRTTGNCEVQRP